jgi:hypothetical protein
VNSIKTVFSETVLIYRLHELRSDLVSDLNLFRSLHTVATRSTDEQTDLM